MVEIKNEIVVQLPIHKEHKIHLSSDKIIHFYV